MSELGEKVSMSIERLKAFAPRNGEGYYLAFSGGKDSVVCKALLEMAGVKYDATYRVTSVDPPELIQFIREKHPDVIREIPRYSANSDEKRSGKPITMWNLIPWNGPPTRLQRFCCRYLKETGGDGRKTVTGVRWAESVNRKQSHTVVTIFGKRAKNELMDNPNFTEKRGAVVLVNDNDESRRMVESCYKRNKTNINPIIDWTDEDVWAFIRAENVPYCGLYDEGFNRLGCIGCPMASKHGREIEFARWPKYKENYIRAFDRMLNERKRKGKPYSWETPLDVFNWWMEYDILPGQMTFDE